MLIVVLFIQTLLLVTLTATGRVITAPRTEFAQSSIRTTLQSVRTVPRAVSESRAHAQTSVPHIPLHTRNRVLRVVSYNCFLRPYIVQNDAQVARAQRIPAALRSALGHEELGAGPQSPANPQSVASDDLMPDAVCMQEVMSKAARAAIRSAYRAQGYAHQYMNNGKRKGAFIGAGLLTVSRHPIVRAEFVPYTTCVGSDCLASKGFTHVQLEHPTLGDVHVLNTHLQFVETLGDGDAARLLATSAVDKQVQRIAARSAQVEHIGSFIAGLGLPASSIVVYAGDWNIDATRHERVVDETVTALHAKRPLMVPTNGVLSVDPVRNTLVGRGGEARSLGCKRTLYTGERCDCCPSRWVDYVVYSADHRQPAHTTLATIPLSVTPFKTRWASRVKDLSDHYPVIITMTFAA
jgi:endonuclease/exonuclease/phosphatase family metal-dependent hydrolase